MNMELRWVERTSSLEGKPPDYLVRVLQYRERQPYISIIGETLFGPIIKYGEWSDWTDVPVETESDKP